MRVVYTWEEPHLLKEIYGDYLYYSCAAKLHLKSTNNQELEIKQLVMKALKSTLHKHEYINNSWRYRRWDSFIREYQSLIIVWQESRDMFTSCYLIESKNEETNYSESVSEIILEYNWMNHSLDVHATHKSINPWRDNRTSFHRLLLTLLSQ